MAKTSIKNNPRATQALDDLGRYLDFCRDYGYRFNEAELVFEPAVVTVVHWMQVEGEAGITPPDLEFDYSLHRGLIGTTGS